MLPSFSQIINPENLTDLSSWAPIFFLLVFNEVGLPLPIVYETILLYTGYELAKGQTQLLPVSAFGLLGSLIGASLVFWTFFLLGPVILASRFFLFRAEKIRVLKRELTRREILAVILGRLTPGLLSLTSIASGTLRLSYFRFGLGVVISNFAWAVLLIVAGFFLGKVVNRFEDLGVWGGRLTLVLGLTALVFFLFLLKRITGVLKNSLDFKDQ